MPRRRGRRALHHAAVTPSRCTPRHCLGGPARWRRLRAHWLPGLSTSQSTSPRRHRGSARTRPGLRRSAPRRPRLRGTTATSSSACWLSQAPSCSIAFRRTAGLFDFNLRLFHHTMFTFHPFAPANRTLLSTSGTALRHQPKLVPRAPAKNAFNHKVLSPALPPAAFTGCEPLQA